MEQKVYEVTLHSGIWSLKEKGENTVLFQYENKEEAVQFSHNYLRKRWEMKGVRAELIIMTDKGKPSKDVRIYGEEPVKTKKKKSKK